MKLIFFMDAMQHAARIARILRAERGNALLVGVGGMGKQSLTRLSSHLCGYKCFQIELTRFYDQNSFHDDMRKLYYNAGEIPNLYEAGDEFEKVIQGTRASAANAGISEGNRDGIFNFFINRVRQRLHLVLCMSPVGDAFRRRCRMFPSLVNCCTIDWFEDWPQDALLSVAKNSLKDLGDESLVKNLASICVTMHKVCKYLFNNFYLL
ncbi:Dynein heavy chain 6 [Blattella germanica]|nr:Dynein heavy chain 6 [Blattella germanica]